MILSKSTKPKTPNTRTNHSRNPNRKHLNTHPNPTKGRELKMLLYYKGIALKY